jgi:capsular exopolysaccharide synthesis family protein
MTAPTPDPRRDLPALPHGETGLEPARPGLIATVEPSHRYDYPGEDEGVHFWDYWRVISRRRWTIISVFLVTLIVVTLWTFTTRPVFTSTATLRIEKDQPRIVKFEEVIKEDSQQDYYQTQYKLLQSRSLANRVIGLLQLDQHPDFQQPEAERGWLVQGEAWLRERLVKWIPVPPPPAPEATEDVALASPLTSAFLGRLAIEPVRNSRLVKISFDSHHPDLAARVPNALSDAFIAQQLDQKVEATRYATQFLAKQLDQTREKLGESEETLNRFLKANDILFVAGDKTGQAQDLISQQLTSLSEAWLRARNERIAKESLVAQASTQDASTLPAVLQNSLISKLKEDLGTQEGEYKRLGQVFKPDYPRMQQLAEKIGESRRQLRSEIDRAVQALQADYQTAVRNEREFEGALAQQRMLARGLADNMAEYNLLRRDVDTSRDLYSALLARLRETQISAALFTSNIYIVDRAEISGTPSRPKRSNNLLVGCIAGLLGGVVLAFVFEYLDTNIKDAKEVEAVLHVPILGMVPAWAARRRRELTDGDGKPFALVAHSETASISAEAFRNLRTSLLYSAPDHPPKTIAMTSLQPEDGKTSLVTNLAITLAQLGAGEVLVIDADMRRPNLHEVLDVPQAPGLSTFLTGQAQLDAVIVPSSIPNLSVIPAGRIPLNPAELLASTRLRQAIDTLGGRFAHIVFDTGPLFGVSDAMILASQVEGVVLVLRHGRASRDAAQRAIRNLISVRARLLGVILNDVDVRGNGYYGYYGYYGYDARKEPA